MKGINYHKVKGISENRSSVSPCVFISYGHQDVSKAREVADAIQESGCNIYFDENDHILQMADEAGNHELVVKRIHEGLQQSSHLLGLITNQAKESWWVPYEIGNAAGSEKNCAFVISNDVEDLPAYLKIATLVVDEESWQKWLPPKHVEFSTAGMIEVLTQPASSPPKFLSNRRSLNEMRFYSQSAPAL